MGQTRRAIAPPPSSQLKKSPEAGVPLLVGTDTPNPLLVAGFSVHDEILALADAGLTPVAILRAATVTPARALGLEHEQGRVAEGQRADLVLLDTDPLEDLDTLRRPSGVLAAGRWLDERELARLLEAARVR